MKLLKLSFLFALVFAFYQCSEEEQPMEPDPDPVNISISGVSINEGNDYVSYAVDLQLSAAAESQITATVRTVEGTAEAGKDYIEVNNETVTFSPGQTSNSFDVVIAGDVIVEEAESFNVEIVSVTGPATITTGTATIELLNDDEEGASIVEVDPVIDYEELKDLPEGSEVPYEIMNFGQPSNVPNAEFTSVATLGDTIMLKEQFSPEGDSLLYLNLDWNPGNWIDYFTWYGFVNSGDSVATELIIEVLDNENEDLEFKYDLHFMIGTPEGRFGPFVIDPKLRIPR